jgi:hypothetical protein
MDKTKTPKTFPVPEDLLPKVNHYNDECERAKKDIRKAQQRFELAKAQLWNAIHHGMPECGGEPHLHLSEDNKTVTVMPTDSCDEDGEGGDYAPGMPAPIRAMVDQLRARGVNINFRNLN